MKDLTIAGKKISAPLAIAGGAAVLYVGYRWYSARGDSSEETTVLPPGEDYGATGSATGTGYSYIPTSSSDSTTETDSSVISTNQQWSQAGVTYATSVGYDPAASALALGKYLGTQPITKDEQNIVRVVLGAIGKPPTGGPYTVITDTSSSPSTFTAPTALRAWDTTTTNQIGLQWNPVTGASGYRIFRTDLGNEPIGDSSDTKFWVKGLQGNTTYRFQVAARTASGSIGPKSSVYTAKTKSAVLKAPTGVKIVSTTRDKATVKWNAVAGADSYRIYVNDVAHGSEDDRTQYTISGLSPNKSYKVTVKADAQNQTPGPVSSAVTAKTKK